MNTDRLEGNWQQLKGKVKEKWGRLTDSDLDVIDGRRDPLIGRIQERYGIPREEVVNQVKMFEDQQRSANKSTFSPGHR